MSLLFFNCTYKTYLRGQMGSYLGSDTCLQLASPQQKNIDLFCPRKLKRTRCILRNEGPHVALSRHYLFTSKQKRSLDTRPREMGPRDLDYDIRPSSPPDPQTPALTSISMFYRDSQLPFFLISIN